MENITTVKQYNCLMVIACVWEEISTVSFLIPRELYCILCKCCDEVPYDGINIASYFVKTITLCDPLQLLIEAFCLCSEVLRSSVQ